MVFSASAEQAYLILRSTEYFQWYVVPLLIILLLFYSIEVRKKNWNRVVLALGFFAGEFIWEMTNALICHFSGYSGLWVTPGNTAFLVLIGLNIEIMFFFALVPFIIFNFLDAFDRKRTFSVFGKQISNRAIIPLILGCACVFVEVLLNRWGALVWDWPFWNWPMIPLILIAYTLPMYLITWVYDKENLLMKIKAAFLIIIAAITLFIVFSQLGWV